MKKATTLLLILFSGFCNSLFAQWTAVKSIPGNGADGSMSFTIDNKGYVGGGTGRKSFYMYDPSTDTWTQKADIPGAPARAWSGSFTFNNKAYVVGGDTSFNGLLKDTWMYDPSNDTWTRKADFPGLRDGMLSWVINGKVYMGGGYDGHLILNDLYNYDPVNDTWTKLSDLPGSMLFASTFVLNNKGYVTFWESNPFFNNLVEYDPISDSWDEKAACPGTARGEGIGFTLNGKGYAGLGQTGLNHTFTDLYEYNPTTDSWTTLADTFPVKSSAWSTVFVINQTAYVGMGTTLPDFSFSTKFYKRQFTATGISDLSQEQGSFQVYPNPAAGITRIVSDASIKQVSLYDLSGKKIRDERADGVLDYTTNLSGIEAGMYLLKVETVNGTAARKLVVH